MRLVVLALVSVVALWLGFMVWLLLASRKMPVKDAARLVPDVLRLIRRLATDSDIPRSTRLSVWLLVAYLAFPIDLVPDFIPVIGYADDVILISVVLRRLIRSSGPEKIDEHWPGTPKGLKSVRSLLRLPAGE